MSDADGSRVYERIAAAGVTGGFLRPGGLALTERAIALCAFPPGSRLLDVGCGTGVTVEHLAARHGFFAVGADPSFPMLADRRACAPHLHLVGAAGENLPFSDGQWDGVFAECSLSVTCDPEAVLRECLRVLKPGGRLVLSDVYARNARAVAELRALPAGCCIAGAPSRDELQRRLEDAGAELVSWEDHSRELKLFAARLILSGWAAGSFWCSLAGAGPSDGMQIERALARARLGYFLAVARKPASAGCA